MSARDAGRWSVVRRAARRVRAEAVAAVVLVAGTSVPVLLLVGWTVGERWGLRSAAPLLLVASAVAAVSAVVLVLARRWVKPVTEESVAAAAERRRGLPDGSLRGVMELGRGLPAGVSMVLFRRTEQEVKARLEGATPEELAGDLGERARGRRMALVALSGGLVLLASAAGFAAPERARAGWVPLLHPVAHMRGPVLPALAVRPGDAEVPRGEMLALAVDAPLRSHVTVEWRATGEVPRSVRVAVVDDHAELDIGPIEAEIAYRVRAPDGAETRTFTARPVDPLMLAGLGVEVVYPDHVGRSTERFDGEPPPLAVPTGTLLRLRGRATRPLERASLLRADGEERTASTSAELFAVEWRVTAAEAGRWDLTLVDAAGAGATAAALDLQIVADAPPRARILAPGQDTVLSPTRRQPLVIEAVDDYGLVAASLVLHRVGPRGDRGAPIRAPIALERGVDRALVRTVLDASAQALAPGDAIEYYVEVRDNSPAGQVGRSAAYLLRVPGLAERRERARSEASELARAAERATQRARELDRATRDLSRRTAAATRTGQGSAGAERSPGGESMDFQRASEAMRLAAAHEDALAELEALRERAERLQDAIERAGLRDPDLERRIDQLRDLYARLDTPELRARAEAVREAAEALDAAALSAELEELIASREDMRARLEESLALLEQAVLDQEMNALAREAEEIAAQQDVLAAAMREELGNDPAESTDPNADPADSAGQSAASDERSAGASAGSEPDARGGQDETVDGGGGNEDAAEQRASEQDELAARTQRLNDLLSALQRQLMTKGDEESASQAGAAQEKGRSGQESMEDAAEQARQGDGAGAAESAEQAAGALAEAARSLDEGRGRKGEAGRQQAQEAVEQAAQDALRLAQREESLRRQMEEADGQGGGSGSASERGAELRRIESEQAAVQQGLEQLGRNLSEATRQSGLLDPEVSRALARALLDMERTVEGLQSGRSMPVQAAERSVESLNRLALALLENDDQLRPSGQRAADQALQRLAELAEQQRLLNAQSAAFAPLDMTAAMAPERLEQMAENQRGIARKVGEVSGLLGGREDVTGQLDQLSLEAAAIAGDLSGGRVDSDVRARQERLFHRLLDAGRTLENEEYSEDRVGERAERRAAVEPDALDPALLDAVIRYPGPDAAQLRTLPAAYRRLILDYFDRLNASETEAPVRRDGGER